MLGLQESAGYWYEKGKKESEAQKWQEAIHAFRMCLDCDSYHWRATLQLAVALETVLIHESEIVEIVSILYKIFNQPLPLRNVFATELSITKWKKLRAILLNRLYKIIHHFETQMVLLVVELVIKDSENDVRASLVFFRKTLDSILFIHRVFPYPPNWASYFMLLGMESNERAFLDRKLFLEGWNTKDYYLNKITKAITYYDLSIKLRPENATVYTMRGVAKCYLNDKEGAINDYNKSVELNPNYSTAYYMRGIIKYHLDKYVEAISDYDLAIKCDPLNALAYHKRAIAKMKLLDYGGAISDYNDALKISPRDVRYYKGRAKVSECIGDYTGAAADHQKAEEISAQ